MVLIIKLQVEHNQVGVEQILYKHKAVKLSSRGLLKAMSVETGSGEVHDGPG